jgi:hypothetical protein
VRQLRLPASGGQFAGGVWVSYEKAGAFGMEEGVRNTDSRVQKPQTTRKNPQMSIKNPQLTAEEAAWVADEQER